jgi:hypothetical protein
MMEGSGGRESVVGLGERDEGAGGMRNIIMSLAFGLCATLRFTARFS